QDCVLAGSSVVERDRHAVLALCQRRDPRPEPAGDGTSAEHVMQPGALDSDEWSDVAPQWLELDVAEHVALLIAELPAAKDGARLRHGGPDTELVQRAHGIGLNRDAGADRVPAQVALDELGIESALVQGGREAQAGNAAAANQDPSGTRHGSPPMLLNPAA